MFLQEMEINGKSTVADIVRVNYRAADVFRKYGIEYCCGARWPLSTVCLMKGIPEAELLEDLKKVSRTIQLSVTLPFDKWDIDFLTRYIINVHHVYLAETLPALEALLVHFVSEHANKYPYLVTLQRYFTRLHTEGLAHTRHEEEVIFPYIRQVAHACEDKDSLAAQLVRTLRKPVARVLDHEHTLFTEKLYRFRELTANYTPPEKACTSHRVVLAKLKELDNDLMQHIYLENEILFPRIIAMEKELLGSGR